MSIAVVRQTECFFIAPIGEPRSVSRKHSNDVLRLILKPALSPLGLVPRRIDSVFSTSITEEIVTRLRDCPLVVALLTELNPNVMYELGIRHAWELPVIPLSREGMSLPFDIKDYQTVFYSLDTKHGRDDAIKQLKHRAKAIMKVASTNRWRRTKQIRVFQQSLEVIGQQFSLDVLFLGKERIITVLCDQLRRLERELRKDFEAGNGERRPLGVLADHLSQEFGDLAIQVEVIEDLAEGVNGLCLRHPMCRRMTHALKDLQAEALKVARSWKKCRGTKRDFRTAIRNVNRLAERANEVLSITK